MDIAQNKWSIGKKITFRFFAVYFILTLFTSYFFFLWDPMVTMVGVKMHVWQSITFHPNGSGDTTYNYLQTLCMGLVSVVITLLWSVLDYKRPDYHVLFYWVQVFLRYGLAFYMFSYGAAKVFHLQFPSPGLIQLNQPMGKSSPMGLAWTFMGYSTGYNLFTGWAEIIGGALLLFRPTVTFGALFSMTVLANIVAMNLCFDIPVKLFSAHLFFIAVFIVTPDVKRLIDFFFLNRPVAPSTQFLKFSKKWEQVTRFLLKSAIIAIVFFSNRGTYQYARKMEAARQSRPLLYGIYTVDDFVKNNVHHPPLTTDPVRWMQLIIDNNNYGAIKAMNDSVRWYEITTDTAYKSVTLKDVKSYERITLNYDFIDSNHLCLRGAFVNDSVNVILRRKNLDEFPLVSRGFHWINERPYNR